MKKRIVSIVLALALCLTLLPTAALAEETPQPVEQGETVPAQPEQEQPGQPEEETPEEEPEQPEEEAPAEEPEQPEEEAPAEEPEQPEEEAPAEEPEQPEEEAPAEQPAQPEEEIPEGGEEDAAVKAAQALIDALPRKVTARNAEDIAAQLAAIDAALDALTEAQLAALELARYEAVCEELAALPAPQAATHSGEHGVTLPEGAAWQGVASLPSESGYYYLTDYVTTYETWKPADGTVLCLNGFDIRMKAAGSVIEVDKGVTFTLCDCEGASNEYGSVRHGDPLSTNGTGVYVLSGTFIMYGGRITENIFDSYGGGVCIANKGSFTMYGGEITANQAGRSGGGVAVGLAYGLHEDTARDAGGTFIMYGGEISGNNCNRHDGGGGVDVESGSATSFTVSGSAQITDNVQGGSRLTNGYPYTGGTASNVYLAAYGDDRAAIRVDGTLDSSANIGVTTEEVDQVVAANISAGNAKRFFSDDSAKYSLRYDSAGQTLTMVSAAHAEHSICGDAACTDSGHALGSGKTWQPVSDLSKITKAGYYYLTQSVTIKDTWQPANGVVLCLNGNSITLDNNGYAIMVRKDRTFTLCDCKGGKAEYGKITHGTDANGKKYRNSGVYAIGTFNMYGGSISGNSSVSSSGVLLDNGGNGDGKTVFNMYGGEITGNTATSSGGGGVYVVRTSTFNMYGGSITNNLNTASGDYGGGVYVGDEGTFTVSGKVNITGNKYQDGTASNVYLYTGKTITIGEDGLSASARIGVTPKASIDAGKYVTVAAGAESSCTADNFFADKGSEYAIKVEGGNVNLYRGLHEHPICGKTCTHLDADGNPIHPVIEWTVVKELTDIKGPGNYCLWQSFSISTPWEPVDGVNLCLHSQLIEMKATNVPVIRVRDGVTFTLTSCGGGRIWHRDGNTGSGVRITGTGVFNLYGGTITRNDAGNNSNGGGVYMYQGGTFNMYGGEITDNKAGYGAGVFVSQTGSFNLYGGEITKNTARDSGGGVYASGMFNMSGGSVTGNSTEGYGGGVYVGSSATTSGSIKWGDFILTGGEITKNTAEYNGGGVYVLNGSSMTAGGDITVTGNTKSDKTTANNIYLSEGITVMVTDALTGGADSIGVTYGGKIASGESVAVAALAKGVTYTDGTITADAGGEYTIKANSDEVRLYNGLPHEHPVCGKTCEHKTTGSNPAHTGEEWKGISSLSNNMAAGNYYLTRNVEIDSTWQPADGVNLCLNGKSITMDTDGAVIEVGKNVTFTLTDCTGSGRITHYNGVTGSGVKVTGGTFNLYDGRIRGNKVAWSSKGYNHGGGVYMSDGAFNLYGGRIFANRADTANGGGVYVDGGTFTMSGGTIEENYVTDTTSSYGESGGVHMNGGTFTMTGGEIKGNTARYYGGVYVRKDAAFIMTGGSITGNKIYTSDGGGVYVGVDASFTVSGNANITGNKDEEDKVNNVYLSSGSIVTVNGALTGANIGVSTKNVAEGSFIAVAKGTDSYDLTNTDLNAIISDAGYDKRLSDGSVLFTNGELHTHAICGKTGCTETGHGDEMWQPLIYDASTQKLYRGSTEVSRTRGKGAIIDDRGITDVYHYQYTLPAGNYYLTDDITLTGSGSVTGGALVVDGSVNLCLNGKTLSTTLTAWNVNVIKVDADSALTLCDCDTNGGGKITSENKAFSCVQPYGAINTGKKSGTFTMYGGTLTGVRNGVAVNDADCFAMYGGTITGNEYGLYAGYSYPITVGGTVNITGNTKNILLDTRTSNEVVIRIDPSLTKDSRIGIATETAPAEDAPVKFAVGAVNAALDYTRIFTPDATGKGYVVTKGEDGGLYLNVHQHSWMYALSEDKATITVTCANTDKNCPNTDGGSVTISAPEHTVYGDGKSADAVLNSTLNSSITLPKITYSTKGGAPTDAGEYTASITLGGVTASVAYSVEKAGLTVTAKDCAITYGDAPAGSGVTYSGFVNHEDEAVLGGQLAYAYNYAQYGDVGSYTVTPGGLTSGNYAITFEPGTLTVARREVTLTWNNTENRTFGDDKGDVTATAGNLVNGDEITVTVSGNELTVGTHTATATGLTGEKAGNYKLPANATQEYTVGKAAAKVTVPPTAAELVYNGGAQPLAEGGTVDGGTLVYSSAETGSYSETVPTGTDAGSYEVWYKAKGDNNHSDTSPAKLEVTISPKPLSQVTIGDYHDRTYTGQPIHPTVIPTDGTKALTLDKDYTVSYGENTNVGKATITVTGKGNYTGTVTRTFNITQATPAYEVPSVRTATYGDTLAKVALPEGWSWNDPAQSVGQVITGGAYASFKATYTPSDKNYKSVEADVQVRVNPAPGQSFGGEVYDQRFTDTKEHVVSLAWPDLPSGETWSFSSSVNADKLSKNDIAVDGSKLTYAVKTGCAVGDEIVITVTASCNNYEDFTYTVTVRLTERYSQTILFDGGITEKTVTYGDESFTLQARAQTAVTYSSSNPAVAEVDENTGKVTVKSAGETTIIATAAQSDVYVSVSASYKLTVNKKSVAIPEEDTTVFTYNGTEQTYGIASSADYEVSGEKQTDAGTYTVTAALKDTANTQWAGGSVDRKTYTFVIAKKSIAIPEEDTTVFTYNGTEQTYGIASSADYEVSGEKQTNAGTYTVTAALKDAANTQWADGSSENKTYAFVISKAVITITVKDVTAYAGESAPSLGEDGYTVTGLIGNDTLTTPPTLAYEAAPDMTQAGTAVIVARDAEAGGNYTIVYVNGKLTIARRGGGGGGAATYPVNLPGKTADGTVTVNPKNASKGTTVTVTVKPDSGYRLDGLTVTDKDGNTLKLTSQGGGQYTFTMPASKVDVKASFLTEEETSPFADVSSSAYYYEAVKWAAEQGITGGTGNGLFSPDVTCTRAQIVTFLWRAAGSPEPKSMSTFSDVAANAYYAKAVAWAIENGITLGTTDTTFSPDATCTRAQSMAFLFRAVKASASGTPTFSDVAASAYYAAAVKWAVDNGITNGIGGGLFGSGNACTRAQIVTFLYRLYAGR